MKRSVNSVAMAASLLVSVSLATGATAQIHTPELGGKGGGPFELKCKRTDNHQDYLIGFDYTAGKALNSITPFCIAEEKGKWSGQEYKVGSRGQPAEELGGGLVPKLRPYRGVRCKRNQFVTALHVWWDKFGIVHHVKVFCHNAARTSEFTVSTVNQGGEPNHDGSSPCPKGFFAVDMVGRYGALIDRIGLVCLGLSGG
jgi:hypothetical protein